jgi:hypothetical protein
MKWRQLAFLPAAVGVLASVGAGPSLAADRPCAPMAVATDARVRVRWPDLREQIHAAFAAREDVDACARIEVTMTSGAIAVKVILPDGRSASRSVRRRQDVVATLQALLLVPQEQEAGVELKPSPPPVAAPATRDPPAPASLTASNRAPPATDVPVPAPATATATATSGLGIELSVLAGARAGDGRTGGGLGVLTFLDLTGWLIGFSARGDFYEDLAGGPPTGALGLAILAGHRFRFGTLALDLTGGPAVALLGTMTSVTQAGPAEPVIRESTSMGARGRVLVAARLNFRARSLIRTFIGVDGEAGRARPTALAPRDIGRLPVWTVGLLMGATVGTP